MVNLPVLKHPNFNLRNCPQTTVSVVLRGEYVIISSLGGDLD